MFYVTSLPLPAFVCVAALTSIASGCVILGFAYGKESVPVQYLGTVSGAINIGNMIGPTLLQPGIGRILEQNWTGGMVNGARVYGVEAFQTAFLLSVSWTLLSCVLSSLRQETGCRQSSVWGGPRADPLVSPLGFTPSQSTILSEQQTL